MKISAINTYNHNMAYKRNTQNNNSQKVSFGFGGDEISPTPGNDFKDLSGGNGNTKETFILLCKIPKQIIMEALGIKPKKNPNEEDPEDFFKPCPPRNDDNSDDSCEFIHIPD